MRTVAPSSESASADSRGAAASFLVQRTGARCSETHLVRARVRVMVGVTRIRVRVYRVRVYR